MLDTDASLFSLKLPRVLGKLSSVTKFSPCADAGCFKRGIPLIFNTIELVCVKIFRNTKALVKEVGQRLFYGSRGNHVKLDNVTPLLLLESA